MKTARQNFANHITDKLTVARRQNEQVYHDTFPPVESWNSHKIRICCSPVLSIEAWGLCGVPDSVHKLHPSMFFFSVPFYNVWVVGVENNPLKMVH